jgi:uncharacterized membrane protein YphA (DoxX/SURF4 family)
MEPTTTGAPNGWLRRFIFRFASVYLILFNLPFPLALHTWSDEHYTHLWQAIIPWVSEHLLQMGRISLPGFINSDSMGGWIRVWCCLTVSMVSALFWVWFDRQRRYDGAIHHFVRVYVRYVLAAAMLSYGTAKVVGMQFEFPKLSQMQMTYADSSPQMLLWTFMGYGTAYSVLGGGAELLAGILLLFRRTVMLGALILVAVMINVVMLNFSYHVGLKLYSMHLLFFGVFLLGPDLNRLADMFFFNRPVAPVPLERTWRGRPMSVGALVSKVLIVSWIFYYEAAPKLQFAVGSHNMTKSELFGIYEVETFTREGRAMPLLLTDTNCWRRVEIDANGDGWVRHMDNSYFFGFSSTTDPSRSKLTLNRDAKGDLTAIVLTYTREAPDRLRLVGKLDGAEVAMLLHRIDEKSLPLVKSKFRWAP